MKARKAVVAIITLCILMSGVMYFVKTKSNEVKGSISNKEESEKEVRLVTVSPSTSELDNLESAEINSEEIYADNVHSGIHSSGFVYVSGKQLFDENGQEFRIKGMCFGNNVWQNPSTPTLTHHDKESYQELENLGFNTIRFYLNYRLFEDDMQPYVYKETAFEWLDQNIQWAQEHNIKLILNMHVPQGGFISAKSVKFWNDEENLSRYVALWCEIAKRYADEPTVLGYGLMNEPFLPKQDTEGKALDLYYGLMEKLTAKIREIDSNHIFFLERPYGIVDSKNKVDYVWGDTGSFRVISDKNTVYEFHFYEYTRFTSQGISWSSFEKDWYYGDDSIALLSGKRQYKGIMRENSTVDYDMTNNEWQCMESPLYNLQKYEDINAAYFLLYFSGLEEETTVYIDDIVIKEYDSKGQFVRDIYQYSFDTVTACSGWDMGKGTGGKCTYTQDVGHDKAGCEMITNAGGEYRLYKNESLYNYLPIKEGNKYKVSCWIRVDGQRQVIVQPSLQLLAVEKVYAMNREFLENKLRVYVKLGEEWNIPIYIGEFGTTSHIMGNEFGGEKWVEDVMDIFNEYSMNYSYHDYHEENYGLYTTPSTRERTQVNEYLYRVFETKVRE